MQILSSETLLSVPVELERSPNTAVFIACVAGAGYFFLRPEKTAARPLCRLPSLDMSSEVLLRFTKGTCVFQFLRIT